MIDKEIKDIKFEAVVNKTGKRWKVVKADWFCNSGCTTRKPSWLSLERAVKDEDGKYCRTDEMECSSEDIELFAILGEKE